MTGASKRKCDRRAQARREHQLVPRGSCNQCGTCPRTWKEELGLAAMEERQLLEAADGAAVQVKQEDRAE